MTEPRTPTSTKLPAPQRELRLGGSPPTPFDDKGHLNEEVYGAQARRFVDAGLDLWVASSGTAEGNVLTAAERDRVTELAVDEAGSRVRCTPWGLSRDLLERRSSSPNARTRSAWTPCRSGPWSPEQLRTERERTARVLRHSLRRDGVPVDHHFTRVRGLRDCARDTFVDRHRSWRSRRRADRDTPAEQHLHCAATGSRRRSIPGVDGTPIRAIDNCALGVKGFTSSMDVNVAPELYTAFMTAWAAQDLAAVIAAYRPMLRLFHRVLGAGGLIIVKAILVRLGLAVGTTRAPRRPAGDAEYNVADQIIAEFGLQRI